MVARDRRLSRPAAPAFLAVGRIGRAHGVRGEVAVEVLTDFPERFAPGAALYVGPEGAEPEAVRLEGARPHRGRLLLHFEGVTDRDEASALTGQYVFIPQSEARALGPDSYYPHELIGLEVVTAEGQAVGRVADLLETGSADVLIVRGADDGPETLVPMIGEVIGEVDLDAGRITITPLPGLLDAP